MRQAMVTLALAIFAAGTVSAQTKTQSPWDNRTFNHRGSITPSATTQQVQGHVAHDSADYYVVQVVPGATYTFELKPPQGTEDKALLRIYDAHWTVLVEFNGWTPNHRGIDYKFPVAGTYLVAVAGEPNLSDNIIVDDSYALNYSRGIATRWKAVYDTAFANEAQSEGIGAAALIEALTSQFEDYSSKNLELKVSAIDVTLVADGQIQNITALQNAFPWSPGSPGITTAFSGQIDVGAATWDDDIYVQNGHHAILNYNTINTEWWGLFTRERARGVLSHLLGHLQQPINGGFAKHHSWSPTGDCAMWPGIPLLGGAQNGTTWYCPQHIQEFNTTTINRTW